MPANWQSLRQRVAVVHSVRSANDKLVEACRRCQSPVSRPVRREDALIDVVFSAPFVAVESGHQPRRRVQLQPVQAAVAFQRRSGHRPKDLRKVALWLGHAHMQTTEMYTRADPSVKLEALEAVVPPALRSGRFKATDKLIASLTARSVMRSAPATP